MRILSRALGLSALLAAGLNLDEWSTPRERRAGGAREGGGQGRCGPLASGRQRAVRIHDLSPQRDPLRARPERRVGWRSGGRPRGRVGSGEKLSADHLHVWIEAGCAARDSAAQGVEPKLERQGTEDLTLLVSRNLTAAATSAAPAKASLVPASAKSRTLGRRRIRPFVRCICNRTARQPKSALQDRVRSRTTRFTFRTPIAWYGLRWFASDDRGKADREQPRSGARNSSGAVHAGGFPRRNRSSPARPVQHQGRGQHGNGFFCSHS